MIPREKAKELFDKMYNSKDQLRKYPMCFDTSKQCALIAVDEILDSVGTNYSVNYWQEVKQEIEKL
jgi:hypothetical protein